MRLWHAPVEEPIMILRSYTENACGMKKRFPVFSKVWGTINVTSSFGLRQSKHSSLWESVSSLRSTFRWRSRLIFR
jgi:hypothetical protein